MDNMHKVLFVLDQSEEGRRHVVELKSTAFSAVSLIHKQEQGFDVDKVELERRLRAFELVLERVKKLNPDVAEEVPSSMRQAALGVVQACVM